MYSSLSTIHSPSNLLQVPLVTFFLIFLLFSHSGNEVRAEKFSSSNYIPSSTPGPLPPNCMPCTLVDALLNSKTAQETFAGEVLPVSINPSQETLRKVSRHVPRCLVPEIIVTAPPDNVVSLAVERWPTTTEPAGVKVGSRQSGLREPQGETNVRERSNIDRVCVEANRFSKKRRADERPTVLKNRGSERTACMFGCTRILFEITFPANENGRRNNANNGETGARGNTMTKMYVLVVTERAANVCRPRTVPPFIVTPTPNPTHSPSPSQSPMSDRSPTNTDESRLGNETEGGGNRRQRAGEGPTVRPTLNPSLVNVIAGYGPCIPFKESSTDDSGSNAATTDTDAGGTPTTRLSTERRGSSSTHAVRTTPTRHGNCNSMKAMTLDHGIVTLGDMPDGITDFEVLKNDSVTTTLVWDAGNGRRSSTNGRKSYSNTKEYVLCKRILHALNTRYMYAALTRNNSVPPRFEQVTQLLPGSMPFLSFVDELQLSAQCLLVPLRHTQTNKSTSKPTTIMPNTYALYALPTFNTNSKKSHSSSYSCPLPCDDRNYYRHDRSGMVAQFVFAPGCKPIQFESCIVSPEAIGRPVPPMLTALAPTNTGARSPVPAIMQVRDDSGDREKVVREAVKRLRRVDGFASLTRADVERTEVRRKNGNTFVVVLWFRQTFEQEF